jgi:hypothetical protein
MLDGDQRVGGRALPLAGEIERKRERERKRESDGMNKVSWPPRRQISSRQQFVG